MDKVELATQIVDKCNHYIDGTKKQTVYIYGVKLHLETFECRDMGIVEFTIYSNNGSLFIHGKVEMLFDDFEIHIVYISDYMFNMFEKAITFSKV